MPISIGLTDSIDQKDLNRSVTLDMSHDRIVAITGKREDGEAVLRSLLINAATRYGPADLAIAVVTSRDRLEVRD